MKIAGTFFLKRDAWGLGIALGLLAPLAVFFLLYKLRFDAYTIREFFALFRSQHSLFTFFGAWCLVGNIALFTAYVNTNRDRTAKGIFAVSLLYGIGVLLAKTLV